MKRVLIVALFLVVIFYGYGNGVVVKVKDTTNTEIIASGVSKEDLKELKEDIEKNQANLRDALNKRIDDTNNILSSVIDNLKWLIGIFIALFGFLGYQGLVQIRKKLQKKIETDVQKNIEIEVRKIVEQKMIESEFEKQTKAEAEKVCNDIKTQGEKMLADFKEEMNKQMESIQKEIKDTGKEERTLNDYFAKGNIALGEKNYYEAIEWYKKAIKFRPNFHEAYNNWGWVLTLIAKTKEGIEKENLLNEAIEKYEKAIKYNNKYEIAYINWGYSLGLIAITKTDKINKESLLIKAKEKLNYAITINSKNFDALYILGINNFELTKIKEGKEKEELLNETIEFFNKAIEINNRHLDLYLNLGWAYGNKKDYDKAIECYKKAIEIKPDYISVYLNLIEALIIIGEYSEAIELIKKANALTKENRDDVIIKWLRCVAKLMIGGELIESEKEFEITLGKEFKLGGFSFDEIKDWMLDIEADKRNRIEIWIKKMEAKM